MEKKKTNKDERKSDDITVKSIFVSELNSELSLSENEKGSIVESFSEDDENIKSTHKSVVPKNDLSTRKVVNSSKGEAMTLTLKAKVLKEQVQPKQPKTEVQFKNDKFGSLEDEDSGEDNPKIILGDYANGTYSVPLPDTTPTSQKTKISTAKLETKVTVKDDSSKAFANPENSATSNPKFNQSPAKVAVKTKMSSPAPFVHSQQAKKVVPPSNSPKFSFDRRKVVNEGSSPAGKSVRRTASPHSPASILEKCACKLLSPGKVNFPIGENGTFFIHFYCCK